MVEALAGTRPQGGLPAAGQIAGTQDSTKRPAAGRWRGGLDNRDAAHVASTCRWPDQEVLAVEECRGYEAARLRDPLTITTVYSGDRDRRFGCQHINLSKMELNIRK